QKRNRDACLERLREMIVRAKQPPKARRPTRMPRGAVERRLDAKKRRSEIKRQRRRPEPPDR
ncbi:MAG: aminoacyl-tRNA hydrolase, partial [Planctomycetota bacterium]